MRSLLILLLFLSQKALCQNLVANGSFEDENSCTEYHKNCSPSAWINSTLQSNFYFGDTAHAPNGQHFVGLVSGYNFLYGSRNFISGQLLCGLRKGEYYHIEFLISPGIEPIDSVGMAFTPDNLLFRKGGLKEVKPAFIVKDHVSRSGIDNWLKVTYEYQATGSETFIALALFKNKPSSKLRVPAAADFSCYIDDIHITPQNPNEKTCTNAAEVRMQLYNENDRHEILDRRIYLLQRRKPEPVTLLKTIIQKIDTLTIPDVFFATDQYALNKKAATVLDSFIASHKNLVIDSVLVQGHTDSTGSIKHNMQLSANRAQSVAAYLALYLNAPMNVAGFASEKPVADNRTPEGRRKNRRVEIYLYIRQEN